eukprot:TRINITY_DN7418_c0_g1_i2.p1 TRINITY_DN7418_c0_g1~~TRINITY_DN7418_c0_g1_i2.p1  ORF type:complete len:154 (+),score=29.91 TRINITY_DN7418_c0_g1_i2:243-704(+)
MLRTSKYLVWMHEVEMMRENKTLIRKSVLMYYIYSRVLLHQQKDVNSPIYQHALQSCDAYVQQNGLNSFQEIFWHYATVKEVFADEKPSVPFRAPLKNHQRETIKKMQRELEETKSMTSLFQLATVLDVPLSSVDDVAKNIENVLKRAQELLS